MNEPRQLDGAVAACDAMNASEKAELLKRLKRQEASAKNEQALRACAFEFQALGKVADAERCLRKATHLAPDSVEAWLALCSVLLEAGRSLDAVSAAERCVTLADDDARVYALLARSYRAASNIEAAVRHYQKALELEPRAEWFDALGGLLRSLKVYEGATIALSASVDIEPTANRLDRLGFVLLEQGRLAEARGCFSRAFDLDPADGDALLNNALSLPIVYSDASEINRERARFERGVSMLHEMVHAIPEAGPVVYKAMQRRTNFFLQYQGRDDRALQESYGRLLEELSPAHLEFPKRRGASNKIRIGFLSAHFRDHSVGRTTIGFLSALDKKRFEVYTYSMSPIVDGMTRTFQKFSSKFRTVANSDEAVSIVRNDRLDIAFFADIGMHPDAAILAAQRVAPVQCAHWGHPITSGLSSVEYYVSSRAMESDTAEAHYSEQLLALSGIGVCYSRPQLTRTKARETFGFGQGDCVILSCQSIYKYLPQFDFLFPRVAAEVPHAKFVFLEHAYARPATEMFKVRLSRAFAAHGVEMERHVVFLPYLGSKDYGALLSSGDLFLDNPPWSGCNTALEAISCGTPIITWPGEFLRGRHVYGMLKTMQMDEAIAGSADDYIALAIRSATDKAFREHLRDKVQERSHLLFDQSDCIREFEAAATEWVSKLGG